MIHTDYLCIFLTDPNLEGEYDQGSM